MDHWDATASATGDWLLDGKRHYGDGLYKRAAEVTGQSARTLEDYKRMADAFEITLRNVGLTYNHHREVASIKTIATDADGKLLLSDEPDQAKIAELLGEAEKHGWSVVANVWREEELLRPLAKEQQKRKPQSVLVKLPKQKPINTRREAAKAAGVGERTYDAGKLVLDADQEHLVHRPCRLDYPC